MSHKKTKKVLKDFFMAFPAVLTEEMAVKAMEKKLHCIKKSVKEGKPYEEYLVELHKMCEALFKEIKGL